MIANLSPIVLPEPSPRARRVRRAGIAVAVCAALAVVALLVWLGMRILDVLGPASPPYHPDNASWRYGANVMRASLYSELRTDDVAGACRAALAHPVAPPKDYDRDEAVSGCRYAEWADDS